MGRAAGSVIHYPLGTAQLALEIGRLLAIKKKARFVGWQLWLHGHEVSEEHWKPDISSALAELKRIPAFLRLMEIRNANKNETIFDQIEPVQFRKTPFAKGLAKPSANMTALAFALLADVAKGNYAPHQIADLSEQIQNVRAISKLIGQPTKTKGAKESSKSDFEIDLETQLEAISLAMEKIQKQPDFVLAQLTPEVRIELATVFQIARQLNLAVPAFEKSPIGRFAKAIADDGIGQAHSVIIWSLFRKMGTILDPDQIAAMAQNLALKSEN